MPKSKYRKISNISGEDFSFQNPYSLPERIKKKIRNLNENISDVFFSEIENAITTYKFEEAVFRRAPTYTDIRIQLDEISLQSEMLHEKLGKLYPGARSFLLQSHLSSNKDYRYLSTLRTALETLKITSENAVDSLKGKKGRPVNAFGLLLIAQLARSCLKNTDINPSQNNPIFMELVTIIGETINNKNLKDIVADSLEQIGR
ncbi:MAG: hypothetical protein VYC46_00455 [Pseudomonadota bacterium]|nr:hypothetical protein [Pseudomonadota bacterium]|tara:strand:+ start:2488 stop:3096 length:609 start_codon:yes stop_codon:yes gene_type:complete